MPEFLENPRRVPRDPVRCRAHVSLGANAVETTTEDIGSRGCQVVLPTALQRGAVVALAIQAPRFPTTLHIEGRVAWVSPEPPWRVGIAYSASRLTDAARWMEGVRQASPELFHRERRPMERVPVDAMVFLGLAPKLSDFTEDELTVLRAVGSGLRVAELRNALSARWPRMQRGFFALLARGFVTVSRAAAAHPVTWKAILGAPSPTPAPGVSVIGDELVLESLASAQASAQAATSPPPRTVPPPLPRRGAPAEPSARPAPTPPPAPRRGVPAEPSAPPPRTTAPAMPVPPPLPTAAASPRSPTRPTFDGTRRDGAPTHDFVGAGVGWRDGAPTPRSPEADGIYQQGMAEIAAKRPQQALALLRRALALAPGDRAIADAIAQAMRIG
jgi:hypothetical protein